MIEDRLAATIHRALRDASGELGLSGEPPEVEITKPFDPSHLVEIVRRALAGKTAQA